MVNKRESMVKRTWFWSKYKIENDRNG